ncbi:MAG: hypothetical protein ACLRY5_11860 [Zhenhengia sp.]
MLKITLIEFILRAIPEAFIHIFAMYAFTGMKLDKHHYIRTSLILGVTMFAIRFLPISYGIHTILIIMAMITLSITLNKLGIIETIRAAIINVIVQFLAEGVNILLIESVFRKSVQEVVSDPITKVLYGIPSLIIWIMAICAYYKWIGKKKEKKYD